MFVTCDPLELINKLVNTGEANLKYWPLIYLRFPKAFCIGIWGVDSQVSVFTVNELVLRKAIIESAETSLTSLTLFAPDKSPGVRWTVHNIVKVWECYGSGESEKRLIFEDDTGRRNDESPIDQPLNEDLIWSSVAS
jgi:hypothetical protein